MMSKKLVFHLLYILIGSCVFYPNDAYDTLDPKGNITIRWDITNWGDSVSEYDVKVFIFNNQLYRQVEKPGWKLQFDWWEDEVIWAIQGAEATLQGDCRRINGPNLPHCCLKTPQIVDLLPGAPYNKQTKNCCRGGVLSSIKQDPAQSGALFQMSVGNLPFVNVTSLADNTTELPMIIPTNFTLGLPGYTCNDPVRVPPSKFPVENSRRETQALLSWNITCTYSQLSAAPAPSCCVSLSAFYDDTITQCPQCSCGCQGEAGVHCIGAEITPLLELASKKEPPLPEVMCTRHMCPIRVHWHVKASYKEYWRVKITIHNFNYVKNYSQWTLVVQHPNLQSIQKIFSFNYASLDQYGTINDTGMFSGIHTYNDMLLQSGNAQSEVLLHKDSGDFTFEGGWAYPRVVKFNGATCVMPPPDDYPKLPPKNSSNTPPHLSPIILFLVLSIFIKHILL